MRPVFISLLILFAAVYNNIYSQSNAIVLKGATIIDLDNYGQSTKDITNAIVIIQDDKIIAVGKPGKIKLPAGATVLNVSGKYIIPGLIDGFGSVTNQAFANAYLYSGVTSVVTVEDNRRGKTYYKASPSPRFFLQDSYWGADRVEVFNKPYRFESVNYRNDVEIKREIDSMAAGGAKVMIVHYGVKPDQLHAIIAACKAHDIVTVGELGFSTYRKAIEAGINSFVHTSRYTADVLPDSTRNLYSYAPFGLPATLYYQYIAQTNLLKDPKLTDLSEVYSKNKVGLMPTGSLLVYPHMPTAKNPWKEVAASIIDEKDIIHEPLDKQTGKPKNINPLRVAAAPVLKSFDSLYAAKAARFLAGSGATAFGTLPGVSLHTELEYLSHVGLTNRQVIAAATNNYALLWNWNHIGKIETGRHADLLVLSADPLQSLEHLKSIDMLFLNGKRIHRDLLLQK